jgi:hypothetical protein
MKKPTAPKPASLQPKEPSLEFIRQGGKPTADVTPTEPAPTEESYKAFSLRLDPALLKELQAIRDSRPKLKPQSIHTFILEAILVAVKKEQKKNSKK